MVLLTLLAIIAIILLAGVFALITLGIAGTVGFVAIFGDVIVAGLIIYLIVKLIRHKKKN